MAGRQRIVRRSIVERRPVEGAVSDKLGGIVSRDPHESPVKNG
jgi:hypothetical protein